MVEEPALQQAEVADASSGVSVSMVEDAKAEAARLTDTIAEAETAWHEAQAATVEARATLDALDDEIAHQSSLVSRHDLEISKLQGQTDTAQSRLAVAEARVMQVLQDSEQSGGLRLEPLDG